MEPGWTGSLEPETEGTGWGGCQEVAAPVPEWLIFISRLSPLSESSPNYAKVLVGGSGGQGGKRTRIMREAMSNFQAHLQPSPGLTAGLNDLSRLLAFSGSQIPLSTVRDQTSGPQVQPYQVGLLPLCLLSSLGSQNARAEKVLAHFGGGRLAQKAGYSPPSYTAFGGLLRRVSRPETWALGLEQGLWAFSPFRLSQSVLLSPV